MTTPALDIVSVVKQYGALRPLRIERLTVLPGDQVAVIGLDEAAAETMTGLVTGATLPDAGQISLFGRSTAEVKDSDEWLSYIDQIGVVSGRAVLLESLSVIQNVSMAFTLEIEPPPEEVRAAAGALAEEAGVPKGAWERPTAGLDRVTRVRVRLARALALEPRVLILEHPNAYLEKSEALALASDLRAVAGRRGLATLLATADIQFAAAATARVLKWEPATGKIRERRSWFL